RPDASPPAARGSRSGSSEAGDCGGRRSASPTPPVLAARYRLKAIKSPGDPDPSGPPGESGKWGRSSLTDRGEFPRPKLILNLYDLALPLCPREGPTIQRVSLPLGPLGS